jgi:transcription initiation factor TFIID TATA-box-binding protein
MDIELKTVNITKDINYTIQNVVASASLFVDVPLEKVATKLSNTEYNPEQFPGLVLRMTSLKITALVFSSGKIVVAGVKSEAGVPDAVKAIQKELARANIKCTKAPTMKVENMVASGDIGLKLNLTELAFSLPTAEYEPEQFPGLVYKVPNWHITFLLFSTGKIVCTGAKNEKEVVKSIKDLRKTLLDAQKK